MEAVLTEHAAQPTPRLKARPLARPEITTVGPIAIPLQRNDPDSDAESPVQLGSLTSRHLRRDLYRRIESLFREPPFSYQPQQAGRMSWGLINAFMAYAADRATDERLRRLIEVTAEWGVRAGQESTADRLDVRSITALVGECMRELERQGDRDD